MSDIELIVKEKIKFLKNFDFEVNYSKKEKFLFITKGTMFVHGIQEMLIGTRSGDSESFNVLEENFINKFKIKIYNDGKFGFKVGTRYIIFDLTEYLSSYQIENEKDLDKIKTTICFFISLHINNIFENKAKKERFNRLISV